MIRSKNFAVIIGNVGRDPEIRQNESLKTATFSIATSEERRSKDGESTTQHTDWHKIVVYRKLADMVEGSIRKGQKVCVIGKFRSSTWDDKQTGQKKVTFYIEADDVFIHVRENSTSVKYGHDEDLHMPDDDIPF